METNNKYLVTGCKGQVGSAICNRLKQLNFDFVGLSHEKCDITNFEELASYVRCYKPNVIVHCAAYTDVEKAETNKEICYDINVNGTKNVVDVCRMFDSLLVYFSTDYIFNGLKMGCYTEEDSPDPINYYGYTKYLGEKIVETYNRHYILRISWVFGENGKNFVKTMRSLSKTKNEIRVVNDQIGTPTYAKDIANNLLEIIKKADYGIYNLTNQGFCSWYEFAIAIFEKSHMDIKVLPVTSAEYCAKAKRPLNSKLSKDKLVNNFNVVLPHWNDALDDYLSRIQF